MAQNLGYYGKIMVDYRHVNSTVEYIRIQTAAPASCGSPKILLIYFAWQVMVFSPRVCGGVALCRACSQNIVKYGYHSV